MGRLKLSAAAEIIGGCSLRHNIVLVAFVPGRAKCFIAFNFTGDSVHVVLAAATE